MPTKKTTKKPRPSGVMVTMTKGGGFRMKAFGPNAPDLRTVVPELLGAKHLPNEECQTCHGNGRIRDDETRELRRCLNCGGSGEA
jgi:DnaJ-class molecular chaperone